MRTLTSPGSVHPLLPAEFSLRVPSASLSSAVSKRNLSTPAADCDGNKMSEDRLIYVGTLARMVRFVKLFSLSTSLVGLSLQPTLYQHASQLPAFAAAAVGGVVGFFILVTPVLLHLVTKRYVIRMTLDDKTGQFTAFTYTLLLRERKTSFSANAVSTPNVPGLFTTIRINGKLPLFIDPDLFIDKTAFLKLMKYDEPLEWEIKTEDKTDNVANKTNK